MGALAPPIRSQPSVSTIFRGALAKSMKGLNDQSPFSTIFRGALAFSTTSGLDKLKFIKGNHYRIYVKKACFGRGDHGLHEKGLGEIFRP